MNSITDDWIFFGELFEFKNLDIFINEEIKAPFFEDNRISNIVEVFWFLLFFSFFKNLWLIKL